MEDVNSWGRATHEYQRKLSHHNSNESAVYISLAPPPFKKETKHTQTEKYTSANLKCQTRLFLLVMLMCLILFSF